MIGLKSLVPAICRLEVVVSPVVQARPLNSGLCACPSLLVLPPGSAVVPSLLITGLKTHLFRFLTGKFSRHISTSDARTSQLSPPIGPIGED